MNEVRPNRLFKFNKYAYLILSLAGLCISLIELNFVWRNKTAVMREVFAFISSALNNVDFPVYDLAPFVPLGALTLLSFYTVASGKDNGALAVLFLNAYALWLWWTMEAGSNSFVDYTVFWFTSTMTLNLIFAIANMFRKKPL